MAFPKRYRGARPPGYEELTFRVLANPDGKLFNRYFGDAGTEESAVDLGAALSEAYGGDVVKGYGATFDFSTPEGAIAAVTDEALPIDLRAWIRAAPYEMVRYERETIAGNWEGCLIPGN